MENSNDYCIYYNELNNHILEYDQLLEMYHEIIYENKFKLFGINDWICLNIQSKIYYYHITNIILYKRYLFHNYLSLQYNNNNNNNNDERNYLQFPNPIYLNSLYNNN